MQYRVRRHAVSRPVTVHVEGAAGEAHMMDVSEGGLKLMVDGVEPSEWIVVEVGRLRLRGTVRWISDGYAGVKFESPLEPAAFAELVGRSARGRAGGGRRHLF